MYLKKKHIKFSLVLLLLVLVVPMEARHSTYFRLRGEQLYLEGRYLDALEMFAKYEEGNPDEVIYDEAYLHRKAEINYKLAFFDDALTGYLMVLDTDPENVNYTFLKGLIYRSTEANNYSHILAVIDSVEQNSYAEYNLVDTAHLFSVDPFYALNTEFSEFSAVDFKGRVYFAANSSRYFSKKDVNTELTYYNVYSVDSSEAIEMFDFDGRNYLHLSDEEKDSLNSAMHDFIPFYEEVINTSYNNGPITFYDDDIAFVTVNEKHKKRDVDIFNLTLKSVSLTNDTSELISGSEEHYLGSYFSPADVGQITFSKDRTKACVAVKLHDGSEHSDLWFFAKDDEGSWGIPTLGDNRINSEYDDLFPYWADDNYLYYSSEGFRGVGGLDVFRIDMSDSTALPQNVGLGVNTPYDDFAFSIDSGGNGYLTSNRIGGRGSDDIYTVAMNYGRINVILLGDTAWVDNPDFSITHKRVVGNVDSLNIKIDTSYVTDILPYGEYDLNHSFPVDSLYEHIALYQDTVKVYVQFTKIPPDTLPVRFTNFCFDCDGMDEINADKFKRIVAFLIEFPEIEMELTGNTDMFGTHKYNDALGMRRSDIMERWLREAGVVNPIVKKSNGKRQLLSQTDSRLNRRVDVELFWPEDPERIEFVSSEDEERLDRDVVILYDSPREYDKKLASGYYILIYTSTRYLDEAECAEKYGLGKGVDILLHSKQWNRFYYYLDVSFETALEAQDYIESLGIRAKVKYLKQ